MNTAIKNDVLKHKRFRVLKIAGLLIISLIFLCFLTLGAARLLYAPILRAANKIGAPGIDLMEVVEIGGIEQLLYFRGGSTENPVILFIHGGPGTPFIPFLHGFQYDLEKDYTIVHWDQRNSGKTFYLNDPDHVLETMTFDRAVEDAHEVAAYIKNKLGKEKIILLGHSWGSVIGTALAQTYPDDYIAYIGVGQIINMTDNERVAYEAVLEAARGAGNRRDVETLESFAPHWPPQNFDDLDSELDRRIAWYKNKYNLGIGLKPLIVMLSSPYYGLKDLMSFTVDLVHYQEPLLRYLYDEYDIRNFGAEYQIPVFYIMGVNDYQTPYPLAKEFFGEISAPVKMFFSIPDARHMTMTDNKNEFNKVMIEEIRPVIID